jgi:hypothetical protein
MSREDQAGISSHAAQMLRAVRYGVDLDPSLDTTRTSTPANPLGPYTAGAEVLRLTDRIRSAENGADLQRALDHFLHPEHGALERVREALEAADAQITGLNDEAYRPAGRFGLAADLVFTAQAELTNVDSELRHLGNSQQSAALAVSSAAATAKVSPTPGTGQDTATGINPSPSPGPRAR